MPNPHLVLVRHGQSLWNKKNLFTGWRDIDLSEEGMKEALETGALLKKKGISFDRAYTSVLKRAIRTLWLLLEEMDLMWIPVTKSWRLNERHYGTLQSMDKKKAAEKYGKGQVMEWRRGFSTAPPEIYNRGTKDPRYGDMAIPGSESLKTTQQRVLHLWERDILPQIKRGQSVLISAHGNSLRALMKHLEGISDEGIYHVNIKTGEPVIYKMNLQGTIDSKIK